MAVSKEMPEPSCASADIAPANRALADVYSPKLRQYTILMHGY